MIGWKALQNASSVLILIGFALGWPGDSGVRAQTVAQPGTDGGPQPQVFYPVGQDLTPALLEADAPPLDKTEAEAPPRFSLPHPAGASRLEAGAPDPVLQTGLTAGGMPAPLFSFDGLANSDNQAGGVIPPDPIGDVGPNHYVQWVNLTLTIWKIDRNANTAERVYGPAGGNAIWKGFGGACETANDGDPIVLYDHLASRWLISQFALPSFPYGPFYQCIAVSQSDDPTGAWRRYAYRWKNGSGLDVMNDYPKFGVWPDGYYLSLNQFTPAQGTWRGQGVAVFEREKMLLGQPARMIAFDLITASSFYGGLLPADLDGPPPPPGSPNVFVSVDDTAWLGPSDALRLWEFHVDWRDPQNSTFGVSGHPDAVLQVADFVPLCSETFACIPQPNTRQRLDAIGDRLMYRLQYRNFGDYSALVANHTVDAGAGRAGIRWFELREAGSGWSIYQQGTYAGDGPNGEHRWMGSAAMDGAGNLALGYSVSSGTVFPSLRYAGRLSGDPPGVLAQGEGALVQGAGAQLGSYRWGDYSMLVVDSTDDCTFWYTGEYYAAASNTGWRSRIGSFKFPNCAAGEKGSLQGQVTEAGTGRPLQNVRVEAGAFSTITDRSGVYRLSPLPVGAYTLTASLYGYEVAASNVQVGVSLMTQRDFSLNLSPRVTVQGTVLDGSGQGWPLYARVEVTASGFSGIVFTDPVTGKYALSLAADREHSLKVTSVLPGYEETAHSLSLLSGDAVDDFSLPAAAAPPCAPGYMDQSGCRPQAGGLILGHVFDANTGEAVNGATVTSSDELPDQAVAFATPDDPEVQDGFFVLFSALTGPSQLTASAPQRNYGSDTHSVSMGLKRIGLQNFFLPAGRLSLSPSGLSEALAGFEIRARTLEVTNTGGLPVSLTITEIDAPPIPDGQAGPFAVPARQVSPKRLADLTAEAVYEYLPRETTPLAAGRVVSQWSSGLAHPWGIGLDPLSGGVWLGDVGAGGEDRLIGFRPDGAPTGAVIVNPAPEVVFGADLTYNPRTKTLWQVRVGGENCLVELDGAAGASTGGRICPPFDHSQRGLAYDPLDDTYYSGSWVNGILYHFDPDGEILDSANLGVNIAGLALNPTSGHLFALSNARQGYDVYVLDARRDYAVLGGFDIPGLEAYQQAGLELDCQGHLWTVNQGTGLVLEVDSGELAPCDWNDIPWLALTQPAGELLPGESQTVILTLDARLAPDGETEAHLLLDNNTPYGSLAFPVGLEILPGTRFKYYLQLVHHNYLQK